MDPEYEIEIMKSTPTEDRYASAMLHLRLCLRNRMEFQLAKHEVESHLNRQWAGEELAATISEKVAHDFRTEQKAVYL